MTLMVRNGLIVTQDSSRRILTGNVVAEGSNITGIGDVSDTSDKVIDAKGGIIMPGMINTHTHVAMTGFRGRLDDMNLEQFLEESFRLDAARTSDEFVSATDASIREMISGGTTAFSDLYYSEDVVAERCEAAGIRGFLAWVVLDREATTQKGDPLQNADHFARSHLGSELVTPMVGLQGVYVCSGETVMGARQLAEKMGLHMHMHLSETRHEVYGHVEKTGKRPVEWLEGLGFLGEDVHLLAAHGAWLTKNEISMLHRSGVAVSHCARSNMKLGSGIAPVDEMLKAGVCVSIGTDSATTSNNLDMFEEMRTASFLQKVNKWDAAILPAQRVLDMATREAARAVGAGEELGSLEVGKRADIVVLDRGSCRLAPLDRGNAVRQLVYSAQAGDVSHTIVNGSLLYADRKFA